MNFIELVKEKQTRVAEALARAKRENVKILKGVAFRDGFYWAVAYTPAGLISYRLNGTTKAQHEKQINELNILTT